MDKLWRRVRRIATGGSHADEPREKEQQAKDQSTLSGQDNPQKHQQQAITKTRNELREEVDEADDNDDDSESTSSKPVAASKPRGSVNEQQVGGIYDCLTPMTRSRLNTLAQIGEDWLYLALLGIIMALLSLFMDSMITMFLGTRIWLSEEMSEQNLLLEYLAWCLVPILLVTFSTGFVHLCSPTAIGSGIPEMKTILRGVVLNEYLTFRTLIAKIVGLTFTLGSGLPLGKEGPSVHMASIVATLLSKLVASFQGIYENESRTSEMLSAACAVGVAATFYAPIGGVLFSIEVTTVYFAIRNYWRGFFAACCGATIWRLLGFYIQNDESISAIFKTNFSTDYPFDPVELLLFSFIGATCGLAAAGYIKFHREIVQFFRRHKRISGFLQKNRFVYPTLVTLIITTSTFPPLLGQYTAATLSTHTTIEHLFSNRTWSQGSQDLVSKRILDSWTTESTSFHLHLILYILMLFWTSALASTIPTPSGVFIPVVKMGAAYGRLIGELMAAAYPNGIKYSHSATIVPGSYAVVGAAAFSGAVTHTVSTSVILFEMTGQIVHIIPVILGVLISNAVCQSLQPSIYDSIIEIKKLPYLPPIASSNSISHKILVKDFMNTKNIPYIWKERCTYADLKRLLSTHRKIISFPLVESPDSMKLLGSVARPDLLKLLYMHLGRERRLQEVCRRNSDTLTPAIQLLSTISGRPNLASDGKTLAPAATDRADQSSIRSAPTTIQRRRSQPSGDSTAADLKLKKVSLDSSSSDERGLEFRHDSQQLELAKLQRGSTLPASANRHVQPADRAGSEHHHFEQAPTNATASNLCVDDCDHTKLIMNASKNCHKYGATVSTSEANSKQTRTSDPAQHTIPTPKPTFKQVAISTQAAIVSARKLKSGEGHLLNECQKRENAYSEALKEFGGVAKFVNHYDRGSTMDEDHLERSIQEVEGELKAKVQQNPPEIIVVVESLCDDKAEHSKIDKQAAGDVAKSQNPPAHSSQIKRPAGVFLQPPVETPSKSQARASYHHKPVGKSSSHPASKSIPAISNNERRPSPVPSPNLYHHYNNHLPVSKSVSSSPSLSSRPTKSILKTSSSHSLTKRTVIHSQSFTLSNTHASINNSHADQRRHHQQSSHQKSPTTFKQNLLTSDHLLRQAALVGSDKPDVENGTGANRLNYLKFALAPDLQQHKAGYDIEAAQVVAEDQVANDQQTRQRRKVRLPRLRVVDMTPEEQEQWEREQLSAFIELNRCQIDEAPFQLVEQTSLYRVHTLFSMLGLNHAYVTSFGRLVGIVALKDIRYAIEKMLQEKV